MRCLVFNIFIFILFDQPFNIIADRKTGKQNNNRKRFLYGRILFVLFFTSRTIMNDWKTN